MSGCGFVAAAFVAERKVAYTAEDVKRFVARIATYDFLQTTKRITYKLPSRFPVNCQIDRFTIVVCGIIVP